jgi:hypothetical protein
MQESAATEFQMRPLTTGQILDRSFALYRSHFALFAGIAVFPAAVSLLFGLAQLGYTLAMHKPLTEAGAQLDAVGYGISLLSSLARICVYGISIAATTWCIASIYQGKKATMKEGFDFAFRKWFHYILLVIAQTFSVVWLPGIVFGVGLAGMFYLIPGMRGRAQPLLATSVILLGAMLMALWCLIRFLGVSLAIPACVVEDLKIVASIRRSKELLVSRKGRIFLLFLFLIALEMVFFALLIPLTALTIHSGPTWHLVVTLASLGITFLYGVLVSPIAAVGLCLFYFDERVRREGFDIEFLMRKSEQASATAAAEQPAQS